MYIPGGIVTKTFLTVLLEYAGDCLLENVPIVLGEGYKQYMLQRNIVL